MGCSGRGGSERLGGVTWRCAARVKALGPCELGAFSRCRRGVGAGSTNDHGIRCRATRAPSGITQCSAQAPNNTLGHSHGLIQANPDRFKAGNDRNARLRWTSSRTGALDEGCAGAMPTGSGNSMASGKRRYQPLWPRRAASPSAIGGTCRRFAVADRSRTLSQQQDDASPSHPDVRMTSGPAAGPACCQHPAMTESMPRSTSAATAPQTRGRATGGIRSGGAGRWRERSARCWPEGACCICQDPIQYLGQSLYGGVRPGASARVRSGRCIAVGFTGRAAAASSAVDCRLGSASPCGSYSRLRLCLRRLRLCTRSSCACASSGNAARPQVVGPLNVRWPNARGVVCGQARTQPRSLYLPPADRASETR